MGGWVGKDGSPKKEGASRSLGPPAILASYREKEKRRRGCRLGCVEEEEEEEEEEGGLNRLPYSSSSSSSSFSFSVLTQQAGSSTLN